LLARRGRAMLSRGARASGTPHLDEPSGKGRNQPSPSGGDRAAALSRCERGAPHFFRPSGLNDQEAAMHPGLFLALLLVAKRRIAAALFGGKSLQPFLQVGSLSCWSCSRGPGGRSAGKGRFTPAERTLTPKGGGGGASRSRDGQHQGGRGPAARGTANP